MRRVLALVLALALCPAAPAMAQTVDDRLHDARRDRAAALAQVDMLTSRIGTLSSRYRRIEAVAERAAVRLIDAYRMEQALREEMAEARNVLNERASAAYRAGPGALLEAFLSARSMGDVSSTRVFMEAALGADVEVAAAAAADHARARAALRRVERERAELAEQEMHLAALRSQLEVDVAVASEVARAAGLRVNDLERERRRLLAATRRDEERRRQTLTGAEGLDQSE
ncbi:MAG TPA: hypothetical protein VK977_00650, partial [Actinomycetota bacterium]|nr:hypothetical protein [Actinomycetota bacterium]